MIESGTFIKLNEMKGQRINGSWHVTILASLLCTPPDLPDNVSCHE
jgi:hypothetical protein